LFFVPSALAGCSGTVIDRSTPPPASRSDDPARASSSVDSNGDDAWFAPVTPPQFAAPSDGTCSSATSRVTIAANLDSSAALIAEPWSPIDPFAGTNYIQVVSIFDAHDDEHALSVVFRRVAAHSFEYHAIVDAYSGIPDKDRGMEVSAGVLTFSPQGALASVVTTRRGTARFEGLAPQAVAVDFGRSIEDGGTGLDGTISVAGGFTVAGQWQEGGACRLERTEPKPCAWPMPEPTSRLSLSGNLQSGELLSAPWSAEHPAVTSNFASIGTVFDSLGASHDVELYFRRSSVTTWDYHALLVTSPDAPPGAVEVGSGTLSFDPNGNLLDVTVKQPVVLSFPDAAPGQNVTLDFGGAGTGPGHMTAFGFAPSTMTGSADGRAIPSDALAHPAFCN
jgi:hypothetical protein